MKRKLIWGALVAFCICFVGCYFALQTKSLPTSAIEIHQASIFRLIDDSQLNIDGSVKNIFYTYEGKRVTIILKLKGFVQVVAKYIYKNDMKACTLILTNE
ncbi:hypothetical protein ACQKND_05425 [Viridibacillus arvi]|uniref:hypothetical protein n=1 Tax=Viridibacillus arvi TaxID=263475 RepID=UPI003D0748BA